MIAPTENLLQNGVPERVPMAVPDSQTDNPHSHSTLNEFLNFKIDPISSLEWFCVCTY